ncbi:MAG: c-type cytochrome [Ferruginibacter sp.]
MKKTILIFSVAAILYSCGGGSSSSGSSTASSNPDADKGLELIGKSDCFGCHKVKETSVGPAYNKVAQKYEATEANISTLADKVMKGGSGNWGTVPMAGHPAITKEDAVLMVKYVLSLKDLK